MAKNKAANILELIEAEHRQVEQLFAELETAKGKKRTECFQQIYKALNLHARTEELVFYPALREYEETEQYIEEAEEEHEEVALLLEEIKALKTTDPEFLEKITELQQAVQHHVEEEESEIFEAVRECMSSEQLSKLAEEFQQAKAKLDPDVETALTT